MSGLGALLGAGAGAAGAAVVVESADATVGFGVELLLQYTSPTRMMSAPTAAIAINLTGGGAFCSGTTECSSEAGGSGLAFPSLGNTPGMLGCWGLKGSAFFSSVTLGRLERHLQIEWAVSEMQDYGASGVLSLSHAVTAGCGRTMRACPGVWNGAPHTHEGWRASAAIRAFGPGPAAGDRSPSPRGF